MYLTPWFFVCAAFFISWAGLLWPCGARVAYGDDAAMKRAASAGLIVWALISSWAGIDWLELVEPHFHSSIYGLLMIGFQSAGRPWLRHCGTCCSSARAR